MLIIRRSNCTNRASDIVTFFKWPSGMQVEREVYIPDGHLQRVTIPDAVLVQFDVLKMSTTLLETCRGLLILDNDQLDTHLLYFTIRLL